MDARIDEASDRLERVRRFVQAHDPGLAPIVFDEPLPTSDVAAAKVGIELGQIAKSILFHCEGRYGLFVAAGDRRVDAREVQRLLGGKRTRVARSDEVVEQTGFPVGGVCPFALRRPLPVFVDHALRRFDKVYTAAGIPESLLAVPFDDLVAMTGATVYGGDADPRAD